MISATNLASDVAGRANISTSATFAGRICGRPAPRLSFWAKRRICLCGYLSSFLLFLISENIATARRSWETRPHQRPILPSSLPFVEGRISKTPKTTESTRARIKRNQLSFNLFIENRNYQMKGMTLYFTRCLYSL